MTIKDIELSNGKMIPDRMKKSLNIKDDSEVVIVLEDERLIIEKKEIFLKSYNSLLEKNIEIIKNDELKKHLDRANLLLVIGSIFVAIFVGLLSIPTTPNRALIFSLGLCSFIAIELGLFFYFKYFNNSNKNLNLITAILIGLISIVITALFMNFDPIKYAVKILSNPTDNLMQYFMNILYLVFFVIFIILPGKA